MAPMIHQYSFLPFPTIVTEELSLARQQHPPIHSLHEGYAIILEEVRELERLVFSKHPDAYKVTTELAHVAAMCQRMFEDVVEGDPENL